MARYRTYKNGITGHRYKGYYILKGQEKGQFSIVNENKELFRNHMYDYDDCEWEIDKQTCSQKELECIKKLYQKEIYQLSALFVDLMQQKEKNSLDLEQENLYKWVEKIRRRKVKNREF